MVFETVSEATRLWIKGRDFSVGRLLGDTYRTEAEKYVGGALCIFRLAPQDYHRFHVPVDGTVGPMTYITGEYYTVNVSAMSKLQVFVHGINAALLHLVAASDPDGLGRVRGQRAQDRTHRQPAVRPRDVRVYRRNDGGQHPYYGSRGAASEARG